MKEMYEAIFFYGNKILKLEKELDSKWFNAYKDLCEAQFNFIALRKDSITKWTGAEAGTGAQAAFLSGSVAEVKQVAPVEQKKEETKVAAPVKKAAPVQRAPIRTFKNKVWTVENYVNENVKFSGDEEVNHTYVLNFFACRDASITVEGKVKSIMLEGCKKVTLYVDQIVSEINVMNCSNIKIFAKKALRMVTVESTQELQVNLNHATKNCAVTTTCTRSVWVRYPKAGADDEDNDNINWIRMPVGETFESRINANDVLETHAVELIE